MILHWILDAKRPETRKKRVELTVAQAANKKARPVCAHRAGLHQTEVEPVTSFLPSSFDQRVFDAHALSHLHQGVQKAVPFDLQVLYSSQLMFSRLKNR